MKADLPWEIVQEGLPNGRKLHHSLEVSKLCFDFRLRLSQCYDLVRLFL